MKYFTTYKKALDFLEGNFTIENLYFNNGDNKEVFFDVDSGSAAKDSNLASILDNNNFLRLHLYSYVQGAVSLFEAEQSLWISSTKNIPIGVVRLVKSSEYGGLYKKILGNQEHIEKLNQSLLESEKYYIKNRLGIEEGTDAFNALLSQKPLLEMDLTKTSDLIMESWKTPLTEALEQFYDMLIELNLPESLGDFIEKIGL